MKTQPPPPLAVGERQAIVEGVRKAKIEADKAYGIAWHHLEEISRVELILAALVTTNAPVAETGSDKLREMLLAVEDFINEPQRNRDIEPMEVRDYRHELYRVWSPLCQAILSLTKTATHADMRGALEATIGRLMNIVIDAETGETKRLIAANARRAAELARTVLQGDKS
jgi:hypothetical protein